MKTPICDFARRYAESGALRLHMPGHKGIGPLGVEQLDITEINGADSLYEAAGIIRESEENASALFGCDTYYATEGSSQCIRAMVYLALLHAKGQGRGLRIAAACNAHKTFLSAAALLDAEVAWLYPRQPDAYLSCRLTAQELEEQLSAMEEKPTAVYLTSPDYLGNVADIAALSAVCHRHGALLLVDNAHGAYLRFLQPSRHPMDLGADLCCDSAHKTLPVLTGGAYLHIAPAVSGVLSAQAKNALALFGSTSPSYLILQSLDAANEYLERYAAALSDFVPQVQALKERLTAHGYCLQGDEPLKLTIAAKPYGYEGTALERALTARNIVCEFADPDFLVLMLTPETGAEGLRRLEEALRSIEKRGPITVQPPRFHRCEKVLSIREAMLSPCETVPVGESVGRVLAAASVGCPPAVPIVVCGQRIDEDALRCFAYYGITECTVVVQPTE